MKNISDVVFDESILNNYKKEIRKINQILESMENDKRIQKAYKKFINAQKDIKVNYNLIQNKNFYKEELSCNNYKLNLKDINNNTFLLNESYYR